MEIPFEEPLQELVASAGGVAPVEAFAARFPHPFLFRQVLVGKDERRLTDEEIKRRTLRLQRITGGVKTSTLVQFGSWSVESFLKDVVVGTDKVREDRVARIARIEGGWPVKIGSGSVAHVQIPWAEASPVAVRVEPGSDPEEYRIVVEGAGVWYAGRRRAPGEVMRLEEGLQLELAPGAAFQTFTASGLAHFVAFKTAVGR
jgi:hypothetical protein